MRRALLFLLICFPCFAFAQFTTVSGTVTDPNGLPYAFGTITPQLIFSGGTPTLPNGSPYSPPIAASGLDATGHFIITLADTSLLTPGGSKWNFSVCSGAGTVNPAFGKGPVCFSLATPITISGSSQNISTQLNAAALALTATFGSSPSSSIQPIQKASVQTGSTSDVQISNAITALGGAGIVWTDYTTAQTWASCPTWGSNSITLVMFPVTYTYSGTASTCTIPKNVTVIPENGALLNPATGKTIQIQGNFVAGAVQVFSNAVAGQGTIDFAGNQIVQAVYPEWFGLTPSASCSSTNTAQMQAAINLAYGTNRTNGSGLSKYNRPLILSGFYQISGTLNWYHTNGFLIEGLNRLNTGLNECATNATLFNGQSNTYGKFEHMSLSTTSNQNLASPLFVFDYNASQGTDLAEQFIGFDDMNISGNGVSSIGLQIAPSGGTAQGSNFAFENVLFSNFTEACAMIGSGSGGSASAIATNAIAFTFHNGDLQGCTAYGIEDFGGQGVTVDTATAENGYSTQTGVDFFCSSQPAGGKFVVRNVRSESLRLAGSNVCGMILEHSYSTNQGTFLIPGQNPGLNTIIEGSFAGGHGVYYRVSVAGNASGLGAYVAPRSASSGSSTTLVDSVGGLTVNAWVGWSVSVLGGTGKGEYCIVTSNSATTFTCSGGFVTDFVNVTTIAPDNTSTYIVEPNWGTQTTSGGVTWVAGPQLSFSQTLTLDDVTVPGLQIAMDGRFAYIHRLNVTRSDWSVNGVIDDPFAATDVDSVIAGPASQGSGEIDTGLLTAWTFPASLGFHRLKAFSSTENGMKPTCWAGTQTNAGQVTVDICLNPDPNGAGVNNGRMQLINNSSGTPETWNWNADGSSSAPGITTVPIYATTSNCAQSGTAANPSVVSCGSAASGAVACSVSASAGTCTVNTTAVGANSRIIVQETTSENTSLGVTCNTSPTVLPAIPVASKVAGTSFTMNMPTITTNPACFDYWIVDQ